MNAENLNTTTSTVTTQQPAREMYTNDEVEEMVRRRRERDAENLKKQIEENNKLKSKLEELESKLQKGTASTDEMAQLQTAKDTAMQGQQQGMSPEEVQARVNQALEQKQFETKIKEAYDKDPEFKKLVDNNKVLNEKNAPNGLYEHDILTMSYLPNSVAVAKQLMKDPKAMMVFKTAMARMPIDGGVSAMMVLNDYSDRLGATQETAHASSYEPAKELPETGDESQSFDLTAHINSKY
jgi:hypothetical protein